MTHVCAHISVPHNQEADKLAKTRAQKSIVHKVSQSKGLQVQSGEGAQSQEVGGSASNRSSSKDSVQVDKIRCKRQANKIRCKRQRQGGSISALGACRASFFDYSPPMPVFAPPPPPHQFGVPSCSVQEIWPILCTRFMMMPRMVVGSGGSEFLCC